MVVELTGEPVLTEYETVKVVKWGTLCVSNKAAEDVKESRIPYKQVDVHYILEDAAQEQSRHAKRYLEAFQKMRQSGESCFVEAT